MKIDEGWCLLSPFSSLLPLICTEVELLKNRDVPKACLIYLHIHIVQVDHKDREEGRTSAVLYMKGALFLHYIMNHEKEGEKSVPTYGLDDHLIFFGYASVYSMEA